VKVRDDGKVLDFGIGRALESTGVCTHCDQRAVISNGSGVGLCEQHRRERTDRDQAGIRERERARRQIDAAKREK
jgi:hypothetical protein